MISTWVAVVTICNSMVAFDCDSIVHQKTFNELIDCQDEITSFLVLAEKNNVLAFGGCRKVSVEANLL